MQTIIEHIEASAEKKLQKELVESFPLGQHDHPFGESRFEIDYFIERVKIMEQMGGWSLGIVFEALQDAIFRVERQHYIEQETKELLSIIEKRSKRNESEICESVHDEQ